MKLIRELSEDFKVDILEEGLVKSYFLEGITLQGNIRNKNGRIYPDVVLSEAVNQHVTNFMDVGRALGELNHPSTNISEVNYKEASHKFVSIVKEGSNYRTKAKVMDTPNGRILKNLIDEGIKPGISSRALGEVKESGGAKIVQKLFIVSFGDIVSNPSAPDAFMSGVMEGKEWVWEQGLLVEKDISEDIENWQSALKKADTKTINKIGSMVLQDFLNKLVNKK